MTQERASAARKIAAIQLLRAAAALTVAGVHLAFAFADHVGAGFGISSGWRGEREAQAAVMLFFLVSGYVMVVASRALFGRSGARAIFWRRRAIRILPPYWIATALLGLVFAVFYAKTIDPVRLGQSLLLIPYWPDDGSLRPLPFLWTGWTLFYEMAFYGLFGLFVGLRRESAIAGVVAVLVALTVVGHWVQPINAALFAVTRPVILLFAAGMLLALWREKGGAAPAWLRLAALAALGAVTVLVGPPERLDALGFDFLSWCAAPATLLAFAVLGGPIAIPAARWITRAGDASYALYLLHVPMAWFWLWFWTRLPGFAPGPWDFLATALAATFMASWLFYRRIERPLTLGLNRRFAAPHSGEELHRKTP